MRLWLLLLFLIGDIFMVSAQNNNEGKAQRLVTNAQFFIRKNRPDKAEKAFLRAISADPSYIPAYSELGYLYYQQQQYSKAADLFKTAIKVCPQCDRSFALPLATALCGTLQFTQAESVLAGMNMSSDRLSEETRLKINLLQRNIHFGKYAVNSPVSDSPRNMGLRINSEYDEYFPVLSPDDSTLYFTRRTGGIDEDFYIAHRDSCDDGAWLSAMDVGSPPNSPQQEGALFISPDQHYMFFMRCENRSVNGWEAGGCDLYFTYTDPILWAQPVPFGYTINTTNFEGMPSLSSDNRELFFVSDREGGYGGKDIWVSRFEDGLWQIPENLGPGVNTAMDETAPFIAPDNKTLYFTSNGHPGMGGNDIYLTRRNANGTWGTPENLGYPINTAFEEVSFCISPDGSRGFLSSDRLGGFGRMDLYEIDLPYQLRPESYTYVVGKVYDSFSKEPVAYAQIAWNDTLNGHTIFRFQANKGDGSYMAAIPVGTPFALKVYRSGYHDLYDTVMYHEVNTKHPDTLNFPLLPGDYVIPEPEMSDSLLFTFYFKRNDSLISSDDRQRLIQFLQENKEMTFDFWINGYTDDSGQPYINEAISYARARSVAAAIQKAGVPVQRIQVQGWADAHPAVPNDTEENRSRNRRVEVNVKVPVPAHP